MRDDDAAAAPIAGDSCVRAAGDVFVRQAVEAVAAHARRRQLTRQGEPRRPPAAGCGETRCRSRRPAQRGPRRGDRMHRRQIVRLMQRSQRRQRFQRRQQRGRDSSGTI